MNVGYGRLRHFCDEPVCPDPVWKLESTSGSRLRGKGGQWELALAMLAEVRHVALGTKDIRSVLISSIRII